MGALRLGFEERKGRPAAFIGRQGFILGFFALAAPRWGAPCSRPQTDEFPRQETKPSGLCTLAPLCDLIFFFFYFSGFHWPCSRLGGVGEGRNTDPRLARFSPFESHAPFPHGTADFPTRRSTGGGKIPALQPGGGEDAGSAPLTPGWVKAAPRGWTDFPSATRGAATSLAIVERRPREMGGQGLSVMSFVP